MSNKPGLSSDNGIWMPVFSVLFIGFLWLLAASLWQGGWPLFGSVWLAYFRVALIVIGTVGLISPLKKGAVEFLATLGVYFAVAWIFAANTFGSWRTGVLDLACATVAGVVTVLFMTWLARRRDPKAKSWRQVSPPGLANLDTVAWVVLAWALVSLMSSWLARPLPTDPDRFAKLAARDSIVPQEAQRWKELRIGLALSGGGYRAAVFHSGVLQALEDLGIQVNNLSTVSGGSIIGAYYAVGGDPKDFVEAVRSRRLDLKRRLMLMHNAVRLPFPLKVPSIAVELFPLYRFDRLDVQRNLLQGALFEGAKLQGGVESGEPPLGQPRLMIAATDLTYGFQVGLLPDGMLKLGEGMGGQGVYRGEIFEPERHWSLADRVAVSGAFPLAFPARPFRVRVMPTSATGRGIRELLLVDGGIRDNLGIDLLRAADRSAELVTDGSAFENEFMPPEWNLDAMLISNGGAVLGVQETPINSASALPRTFEIAGIQAESLPLSRDPCEQLHEARLLPTFSPSRMMLSPDLQFNLKNDSNKRAILEREWSLSFDPVRYPETVLRRIVERVPDASRAEAAEVLESFLSKWGEHQTRDRRWSRSFRFALTSSACEAPTKNSASAPNSLLPGSCEAVVLRKIVREAVMLDLDLFRTASTLDDRLPRETIDSLERLGQTLVYLQWYRLQRHLDSALECRGSGIEPAAGASESS